MASRQRVLVVGRGAPERGGIPTFLELMLTSGLAADHDLVFVNLARPDLREGGRASRTNLVRSLGDAVTVARRARRGDVVHLHTAFAPAVTVARAGLLVLAARLRGAQVLVHVHGGRLALWAVSPRQRRLVSLVLRPAAAVVAVARGGQDVLLRSCGPDRVSLVPNAVDVSAFVPPARRREHVPPRVLFAGGLTPRKGVVDLLRASAALLDEGMAHELWLAGGTPDEGPVAEAAVRDAAGPQVRFLGARPPEEMPELYGQVDVFCLPSWYEAMPLTLLEAMACGLPVVATRVGDVERMVTPESAVLVEPRDVDGLAGGLRALLGDPARRREAGAAGRRVAEEQWSLERLEGDLRRLYADLARDEGQADRS